MEKRLNAALANALDSDVMSQLMGRPSELMPQELPPNAPKAGRRGSKSVSVEPVPESRGGGALSSRSCGSDNSKGLPSASESELMSSLIRRLTEAVIHLVTVYSFLFLFLMNSCSRLHQEREIKVLKSGVLHKSATIKDLEQKSDLHSYL